MSQTELYKHVDAIAHEYEEDEERQKNIEAAKNFRMPYWDWALPADPGIGLFPEEVLSTTQHTVTRPRRHGSKPLKINPLASYRFQNTKAKEIYQYKEINTVSPFPS